MAACKTCNEALVFRLDDDDDDNDMQVPDDLELRCGCHFHWSCLLDQAQTVALALKCPSCGTYLPENEAGPSSTNPLLPTAGTAILARYTNEGGVDPSLDILPSITEEAYLASHPETQPARAFHVMCGEGDPEAIVELLSSLSDTDDEEELGVLSVLRYQDPLAGMKSALHLAVERGQQEVAMLLLWLCSTANTESFPEASRQIVESAGLGRLSVGSDGDIRGLKDSRGLTAVELARQAQVLWAGFFESGLFL
ncbi:unnamed protein product [Clonostachys solani]|uniref:Uncharacterized protein n=1 Tax=Clonostachys solani TaxID=160281 RepID=A0A9P0ETU3_9HYPO|nr:unnamed protein product [Clonostachys solani]